MDILAKSFILIRQNEPGPCFVRGIGNTPGNAAFIGDPHHKSSFAFQ